MMSLSAGGLAVLIAATTAVPIGISIWRSHRWFGLVLALSLVGAVVWPVWPVAMLVDLRPARAGPAAQAERGGPLGAGVHGRVGRAHGGDAFGLGDQLGASRQAQLGAGQRHRELPVEAAHRRLLERQR